MSSYVSAALRRLVAVRADCLCEYCLMHEDDAVFGCEVDHIISEKHGGPTEAENFAYACTFCNRAKGSDIGSMVLRTGAFVTARILEFNHSDRLLERQVLQAVSRYPTAAAVTRITHRI
jgi:hypothetical protein